MTIESGGKLRKPKLRKKKPENVVLDSAADTGLRPAQAKTIEKLETEVAGEVKNILRKEGTKPPVPVWRIKFLEPKTAAEEEEKIRSIDQYFEEWTGQFLELVVEYADGSNPVGFQDLDRERKEELHKAFPQDLIRTFADLEYFLSKALLFLGKNIGDKYDCGAMLETFFRFIDWNLCRNPSIHVWSQHLLELFNGKPVFYRTDKQAFREIQLDEGARSELPESFFENPTQFIEKLDLIERDKSEFGSSKADLLSSPYDYTRVKRFGNLVFKRVDLAKVGYGTEEIDKAKEIEGLLQGLADPRVTVQKFTGYIYDQGNIYLVSEFIEGETDHDCRADHAQLFAYASFIPADIYEKSEADKVERSIREILGGHHIDLEDRNIMVELKEGKRYGEPDSVKKVTIIDFETKK